MQTSMSDTSSWTDQAVAAFPAGHRTRLLTAVVPPTYTERSSGGQGHLLRTLCVPDVTAGLSSDQLVWRRRCTGAGSDRGPRRTVPTSAGPEARRGPAPSGGDGRSGALTPRVSPGCGWEDGDGGGDGAAANAPDGRSFPREEMNLAMSPRPVPAAGAGRKAG